MSALRGSTPGLEVTARVKLVEIGGRRLVFDGEAHDGVDTMAKATHERLISLHDKFSEKVRVNPQTVGHGLR